MTAERRLVDLHTHSTASDGSLAPAELVRLADSRKLAAVALTNHDTTAGIAEAREAAEAFGRLRFVPGIEVSAMSSAGAMHILGLGIDAECGELAGLTRRLIEARNERNPRIMQRLRELGVPLEWSDVLEAAHHRAGGSAIGGGGKVISRAHIAAALVRRGFVRSMQEAFTRYVGSEGAAYVEKERLGPGEVIAAIRAAGGLAAVAHPGHLDLGNDAQKERLLRDLKRQGIEAVEVYHSDHDDRQTRTWLELARRLDLEAVGGSDFHGGPKPEVLLGRPPVPLGALSDALRERLAIG
ncbi:MAG: PHP domain-containing protein [Phycisphaerae bacterium]